jgi:glycosyltransferase involved in cell wall biosynthesis
MIATHRTPPMSSAETPVVTVIIATYNKKSTLHYAIESVLWQTFDDFECWVIGDCCTDGSEEVVASFNDPRLNWTNLAVNSGYQSAPTNEGLRRAKGQYIAYLNDDDIWLPNHLQELVTYLERSGVDFVYSIVEWVKSEQKQVTDVPNYPDALQPPEASATIHRKDIVDEIGYWKEPDEVHAIPRVDFFRRAQFSNRTFVLVPYLTAIRFSRGKAGYGGASLQEKYMGMLRTDEEFVEKELARLLVDAIHKLDGPISLQQLRLQFSNTIRHIMINKHIDPGQLMFWKRRGQRIERWRKSLGLDAD